MSKFYNPFMALFGSPTGSMFGGEYTTYLFAALTSSLTLSKGTGSPTFTRASSHYGINSPGTLTRTVSGSPWFDGMMAVTNLALQNSNFLTTWTFIGGSSASAADTVAFAGGGTSYWARQEVIAGPRSGRTYLSAVTIPPASGFSDPTAKIGISNGGTPDHYYTPSSVPQRIAVQTLFLTASTSVNITINTDKACTVTGLGKALLIDVTGEVACLDQIDDIPTTTAPVTKFYPTTVSSSFGRCVAIGDSMTSSGTWHLVMSYLKSVLVTHKGVTGQTLVQMEARFDTDVVALAPDTVFILGGINDISQASSTPVAAMLAATESMVQKALTAGIRPVVMNCTPAGGLPTYSATKQGWVDAYNSGIDAYCIANGVTCLDVYTFLKDPNPAIFTILAAYYSGDGTHPNLEGYYQLGVWVSGIIDNTTTYLSPGKGVGCEPAGVNLHTGYSTPGADQYLAELSSGDTVVGKVYNITAYTSVDRTLAGAANNNVGTIYTCSLAQTNTANDKVKELGGTATGAAVSGLGTGARGDATSNPIPGLGTITGTAIVTIASDSAVIAASALAKQNPSGKVIDITTSAGGVGVVPLAGAFAAVPSSMSIWVRLLAGSATLTDSNGTNAVNITSATYVRVKKENFTPTAGWTMQLNLAASSQVRIGYCPQPESSPFCTSEMPTNGATAPRVATVLSYSTADIPTTGRRRFLATWTPDTVLAGHVQYIQSTYTDASNETSIFYDGTNITFRKRVAGVNYDATKALAAVVGQTYVICGWLNEDHTSRAQVDGVFGALQTNTAAPVIAATIQVGSRNGAGQACGEIKNWKVTN